MKDGECREGLGERTVYLQAEAGTAEDVFTRIYRALLKRKRR